MVYVLWGLGIETRMGRGLNMEAGILLMASLSSLSSQSSWNVDTLGFTFVSARSLQCFWRWCGTRGEGVAWRNTTHQTLPALDLRDLKPNGVTPSEALVAYRHGRTRMVCGHEAWVWLGRHAGNNPITQHSIRLQ